MIFFLILFSLLWDTESTTSIIPSESPFGDTRILKSNYLLNSNMFWPQNLF